MTNLYFLVNNLLCRCVQGGRGHWAVYYTSLPSFIITFSYQLAQQLWGLLLNLYGWFIKFVSKRFNHAIIVIYRRCIIIGEVNQFLGNCLIPLDLFLEIALSPYEKKTFNFVIIHRRCNFTSALCITYHFNSKNSQGSNFSRDKTMADKSLMMTHKIFSSVA